MRIGVVDKNVNLFIYIDALIVFISALIWTGLPLYFFNETGSYFYAGSMYLIGGISVILSNFVSGYLHNRLSNYSLRIYLMILFFISCASYLALNNRMYTYMFFLMLIFQFFINALSFILESSFNLHLSSQAHKDIAYRNVFLLTAKTIGFFMGPILFSYIESPIYIWISLLFLALIIVELKHPLIDNMRFESITFKNLKLIKLLPLKYSLVVLVDGMFFPVIMNYSFIILKEKFGAEDSIISFYWLLGGVSVIISNYILKKVDIETVKSNIFHVLIVLVIGLLTMYFATSSYWYLFGFFLLSFINPVFMSVIKSYFLIYFEPKNRSIALAYINTFNELGTIFLITFTIILLDFVANFRTEHILLICLFLGIIRFLFIIKILFNHKKEDKNNATKGLSRFFS